MFVIKNVFLSCFQYHKDDYKGWGHIILTMQMKHDYMTVGHHHDGNTLSYKSKMLTIQLHNIGLADFT